MKEVKGGVCAPLGFQATGIHCGIRKNKTKKDLSLIVSDVMCHAASTYTLNKVKGAPIVVTKQHLLNGEAKAIICNSGNANTCNPNGEDIANQVCELCADALNIKADDIIVASTGVIGQPLDITPFQTHMDKLVSSLNNNGSEAACEGIMTTDTVKKEYAVEFELSGQTCHIGAIAKGSGMIHPNMATMLCFITTDCMIKKDLLQKALSEIVNDTFNMISVDGDTSTNDSVLLLANGMAENKIIDTEDENYKKFYEALYYIMEELSKKIAGDGEGCTCLFEVRVLNALTKEDAKTMAKSVVCSSLTKAAIYGHDANWGRILCAMGYSGAEFDPELVDIYFESACGRLQIVKDGRADDYSEEEATKILSKEHVIAICDCKQGTFNATAYGCDLTHEYVNINADYRS